MNRKYVIGILIAVAVLIVNQLFIQHWLGQMEYDANTINLAGKQRMLSQRINLKLEQISNGKDQRISEVQSDYETWRQTHQDLLGNSDRKFLSPITESETRDLLNSLTPLIEDLEPYVTEKLPLTTVAMEDISLEQADFVEKMDRVVGQLEASSEDRLHFVRMMEFILLGISLFIIILEVFLIYVPIERKLKGLVKEKTSMNLQLERSLDAIKRKNKELEQFTYIASHDLQEPLRTISSLNELISKRYAHSFDAFGKQSMNYVLEATNRMRDLIKGLLDYSRIGRVKEKNTINCEALIQDISKDLSYSLIEADAELKMEAMPEVVGYKTEMRLLLQNLISNAIKFRKESEPLKVTIAAEEEEDHWKFSISDNGIGIAPEHQEKIFSIFQRIHPASQYEGTGIGLAYCKKIVDLHAGDIWVESAVDEGSTFYFTIANEN